MRVRKQLVEVAPPRPRRMQVTLLFADGAEEMTIDVQRNDALTWFRNMLNRWVWTGGFVGAAFGDPDTDDAWTWLLIEDDKLIELVRERQPSLETVGRNLRAWIAFQEKAKEARHAANRVMKGR